MWQINNNVQNNQCIHEEIKEKILKNTYRQMKTQQSKTYRM